MNGKRLLSQEVVAVRGGGDLATGVIQKLYRAGLKVVILETERPLAIRRTVSLCTAVTNGAAQVEDMQARLATNRQDCLDLWGEREIPIMVDPEAKCLGWLKPDGLVDAILAKRNLGTSPAMAPIVIAMGPGFSAPKDAHAVVETMRGHTLGKVIFSGSAIPNTGVPGVIGGKSAQRVLRAPCDGIVGHLRRIGDVVEAGEALFTVNGTVVVSPFPGVLRGLIEEGMTVPAGMKTADVDPRIESDCFTISDKARCIGGGVLDAYLYLRRSKNTLTLANAIYKKKNEGYCYADENRVTTSI